MFLRKWDELPEFMRNDEVKVYYDIISKRKLGLFFKRIFDVIAALILLVLLSPVILIFSIWIKLDSKGGVFYRQERITTYAKTFKIFKFRTMVTNADKIGTLVTTQGDSRITRVGHKIRKYRIDEIPQLFNVIKGEMSFVGTRPEVKKYVDKYSNEMFATLLLPAGVTSTASIEYKDEDELLSRGSNVDEIYINEILPEKMKYNILEIKNFSFFKNIGVMLKTVLAVIK